MDDLQRRFERLGPLFRQMAAPALSPPATDRQKGDGAEPPHKGPCASARAPWGFATTLSLDELTRTAEAELAQLVAPAAGNGEASPEIAGGEERARCRAADDDRAARTAGRAAAACSYRCAAFRDALTSSRTYRSPHCETAMAEALGVSHLYGGLVGSTLAPVASPSTLEQMRMVFKDHINAAWSLEAVKQGVAHAKQGNYEEAHRCYAKALELHPGSAEAHVARGAAHANQRSFQEADQDFRTALQLDPGHRNAAVYLEAIAKHVEEQREAQREQLDLERQLREREQQQRDEHAQRRRRSEQLLRHGSDQPGLLRQVEQEQAQTTPTAEDAGPGRRPDGWQQRQPGSAPAVLRQQTRQGSASSKSTSSSDSGSGSSSRSGSPGESSLAAARRQQPAGQPLDIRRALEVVLKARKSSKTSKHRRKSKHKKQKHKKRRRE